MCVKDHTGKGWDRPREAPGDSVEGIKSPVEMARGTCPDPAQLLGLTPHGLGSRRGLAGQRQSQGKE